MSPVSGQRESAIQAADKTHQLPKRSRRGLALWEYKTWEPSTIEKEKRERERKQKAEHNGASFFQGGPQGFQGEPATRGIKSLSFVTSSARVVPSGPAAPLRPPGKDHSR